MLDVGEGSDRSSNELKAQAYTEPWSPNDYSSDPDYDAGALSYTVEAFDSFPVQEKELVADGGEIDPRLEEAEENAKTVDPNPDFSGYGTRERDWSDHPSEYDPEMMGRASEAFELIMGEEEDLMEVSENHPMDNIGQNSVTRR